MQRLLYYFKTILFFHRFNKRKAAAINLHLRTTFQAFQLFLLSNIFEDRQSSNKLIVCITLDIMQFSSKKAKHFWGFFYFWQPVPFLLLLNSLDKLRTTPQ